ncbi:MAG: Uma2 family endonuclease [Armatimonadota bacterium]|nr:Uma2 family endonuclease [Armatimonadota bacterium]
MRTAPKADRLTMSYEEFRRWAGEDTYAEWVDGEVILSMPPRGKHQDITFFLAMLFEAYIELTTQGRVRLAPFETFLPSRPASREPDIIVVLGDNLQHLTEERFTGAPDIVVEVISEDSVRRDRVEKFLEYEREGVREYWLIDSRPGHAAVDAFTLEQGSFVPLDANEEGWLESRVLPGFRVKETWFTSESLPEVSRALSEMLSPELKQKMAQKLGIL